MTQNFLELGSPRRFAFSEYDKHWFDAAHQHVVLLKDASYRVLPLTPVTLSVSPVIYSDDPGQACLLARLSLDMKLLALQRSVTGVAVVDLMNAKEYLIEIGVKAKATDDINAILPDGIVWSDHGGNSQDLVIFTERGVDIYKVSIKRGQCKLSRQLPHPIVKSFWYNPEQRLILLGTGNDGTDMRGYYLRFETTDLPKLELPPPEKLPRWDVPCQGPLDPKDMHLVRLYGRMYAVHVNTTMAQLNVLSLERDQQVVRTHTFLLYVHGPVRVNTVDNLLCVHSIDSKVSMVYDLRWRSASDGSSGEGDSATPLEPFVGGSPVTVQEEEEGLNNSSARESFYDASRTRLWYPHWVLEVETNCLWSLQANLRVMADSQVSIVKVLPFLLRRGHNFNPRLPGYPRDEDHDLGLTARAVALSRLRDQVVEKAPVDEVSQSIAMLLQPASRLPKRKKGQASLSTPRRESVADRLVEQSSRDVQHMSSGMGVLESSDKGGDSGLMYPMQRSPEGEIVFTQEDIAALIVGPAPDPSSKGYLASVLIQAVGVAQDLGLAVDPHLPIMAIRSMKALGQHDDIIQFLRIQQTSLDSEAVASLVLEMARDSRTPQLSQLARDMLLRIQRGDVLLLQLLRDGHYGEALRTARQFKRVGLLAPPLEPVLLQAMADAATARAHSLPPSPVSHRAAVFYVLFELLMQLDSQLFPGSQGVRIMSSPPRRQADSALHMSFAEVVHNMPFEELFPGPVAQTLARQVFGFERPTAQEEEAGQPHPSSGKVAS